MRYIWAVMLLSGCAASIPDKPIVNTVTVQVPVQVPCTVSLPEKPVFELSRTSPDASLFDLAKAAVIEIRQRAQYQTLLEAAAKACSE